MAVCSGPRKPTSLMMMLQHGLVAGVLQHGLVAGVSSGSNDRERGTIHMRLVSSIDSCQSPGCRWAGRDLLSLSPPVAASDDPSRSDSASIMSELEIRAARVQVGPCCREHGGDRLCLRLMLPLPSGVCNSGWQQRLLRNVAGDEILHTNEPRWK